MREIWRTKSYKYNHEHFIPEESLWNNENLWKQESKNTAEFVKNKQTKKPYNGFTRTNMPIADQWESKQEKGIFLKRFLPLLTKRGELKGKERAKADSIDLIKV